MIMSGSYAACVSFSAFACCSIWLIAAASAASLAACCSVNCVLASFKLFVSLSRSASAFARLILHNKFLCAPFPTLPLTGP